MFSHLSKAHSEICFLFIFLSLSIFERECIHKHGGGGGGAEKRESLKQAATQGWNPGTEPNPNGEIMT